MAHYSWRGQVPPFGHWNSYEAASPEGNVGFDGCRPYPPPQRHVHPSQAAKDLYSAPRKAERGRPREKKEEEKNAEDINSGSQSVPRRQSIIHMAVDEDLYKIPPELLLPKSSTKSIYKFIASCLRVSSTP